MIEETDLWTNIAAPKALHILNTSFKNKKFNNLKTEYEVAKLSFVFK